MKTEKTDEIVDAEERIARFLFNMGTDGHQELPSWDESDNERRPQGGVPRRRALHDLHVRPDHEPSNEMNCSCTKSNRRTANFTLALAW